MAGILLTSPKTKLNKDRTRTRNPLGQIHHLLDQIVYKDEVEYLERFDVPLQKKFEIVARLSEINEKSGYNAIFLSQLGDLIRKLKPAVPPSVPIKILDMGVGGGGLLEAIYQWSIRHERPVALYGIDLSPEFIQAAKLRLHERGVPATLWQANACRLKSQPDESFDIVISSYMVHHIRNRGRLALFLAEAFRIAKRGWLIADFERRLLGPAFSLGAGLAFGARGHLLADGIKSIRRAYRAREINEIIHGIRSIHDIQALQCQSLPMVPYWMIKGIKKNSAASPDERRRTSFHS